MDSCIEMGGDLDKRLQTMVGGNKITSMVEIKKGAEVNLQDGDIRGGAGGAGVTIGEKATVNIGSGDIIGGDKTTGDVVWQQHEGRPSRFSADPDYDEDKQQFKKEVDVCGNVKIMQNGVEVAGSGTIDLHQALGDIGGRIILGPDLIVDLDSNGGLTICGIQIDNDMLRQLQETPFEIARVTDLEETREKSRPDLLAEVTVTQRISNLHGTKPKGERILKLTVFQLGDDEKAETTPVRVLQNQPGDEKRQAWKKAVTMADGKKAQLKVLYVKKK